MPMVSRLPMPFISSFPSLFRHLLLRRLFLSILLLLGATATTARAAVDESVWALLKKGGNIILLRHAQTEPGIGDPAGFTLGRCETQRNLSAQGRADAAALGAQFRARAIPLDAVFSSRWCRALDTATLAFGRVTPAPMLDSMFKDRIDSDDSAKRDTLFDTLAARRGSGNVVLVTHAVNIAALTGVSPASGEMIVTRLAGPRMLVVIGRGAPD